MHKKRLYYQTIIAFKQLLLYDIEQNPFLLG